MVRIVEGRSYLAKNGDLWEDAQRRPGASFYRWDLTRAGDGAVHAFSAFGRYHRGSESPADLIVDADQLYAQRQMHSVINGPNFRATLTFQGDLLVGVACEWNPTFRPVPIEPGPQPAPASAAVPLAAADDALLSVADLQKRWRVSRPLLGRLRKAGLKSIKVGNFVRFKLADIEAWEQAHEGH